MANRIREWRNRRRMSLAELGEIVGLSRSEISKLESGSRRVRADHLVVLAKALKVAPEDLMDKETVRELIGDSAPARASAASLTVAPVRRQNGTIRITLEDASVSGEAPPQIANVAGAYAFYMPDTSMEPRVPVGALLYVHPLLPPRAGDLAVITCGSDAPALASIERHSNALVAIIGPASPPIDLNDASVTQTARVAGLWFP
ncbi:MAG TPA: helix-turn-helix domain-containing protein [Telmatospirillum sp.]|nr:helix-turn-helix domain-containing protein [Telmatospirillum sp.]